MIWREGEPAAVAEQHYRDRNYAVAIAEVAGGILVGRFSAERHRGGL